jgi:hypothetical protein
MTTFFSLLVAQVRAQSPSTNDEDLVRTVHEMQQQIQQLQGSVDQLRSESQAYRSEIASLRRSLDSGSHGSVAEVHDPAPQADSSSHHTPAEQTSVPTDEELRLLEAKVNDQYQTKVESGSKYRVKLSGLILLNLFENRGTVNSIDVPGLAGPKIAGYGTGAFAATLRQSQIGLDVFGPSLLGARVSGNVRFDFAGGFPDTSNGVSLGLARLRTGGLRLDWPTASLVAEQETPFFSPLSPTSLASQAEPVFSYSGNLWTWIPQLYGEKRIPLTENDSFSLQGGILDPLTGEPPLAQYERRPQAGETSRQPGFASRISWRHGTGDNATTIGVGGYYSRQDYGFSRNVDGWSGTADWQIALPLRLSLSGEFYRGRGIGGLGAATYHSVLASGVLNDSQTIVSGLNVIGGWSQLKFRATPKLQLNGAFGQDSPFSNQLRQFQAIQVYQYPPLGRNRSYMANFIYQVRSNLLLSTEYRHIGSVGFNEQRFSAEHINLSLGVLF